MVKNSEKILKLINESYDHMTAEQIYNKVLSENIRMAKATVYNNLNSLYEKGLIRKILMDGQPDRYDKILRHDHIICKCCGKLSDLSLADLTSKIERESGISIDSYDLKIFYTCDTCKQTA